MQQTADFAFSHPVVLHLRGASGSPGVLVKDDHKKGPIVRDPDSLGLWWGLSTPFFNASLHDSDVYQSFENYFSNSSTKLKIQSQMETPRHLHFISVLFSQSWIQPVTYNFCLNHLSPGLSRNWLKKERGHLWDEITLCIFIYTFWKKINGNFTYLFHVENFILFLFRVFNEVIVHNGITLSLFFYTNLLEMHYLIGNDELFSFLEFHFP